MRTRKRLWKEGGVVIANNYGSPVYSPTAYNSEVCTDEVHRGPPYLAGGPFAVSKVRHKVGLSASVFTYRNVLPEAWYSGRFYCPLPAVTAPTEPSLSGWGAIAWNRNRPVSPVASVSNFLAELRDIPKMIRQTMEFFRKLSIIKTPFSRSRKTIGQFLTELSDPKGLGSDYLNLNFGWVPFVKDLIKIYDLEKNMTKKLTYLKRNNGKTVRKRMTLLNTVTRSSSHSTGSGTTLRPIISSYCYALPFSVENDVTETTTSRRIWFEAKFVYYIPELADPKADLTSLKYRLSGLTLDPEVIYNAVPWTWLLDYFTNTGSVISNMVDMFRYHTVAKYAYIMQHYSVKHKRTCSAHMNVGTYPNPPGVNPPKTQKLIASSSSEYEFKRREVANPFGFGITDASLSDYQWSILVALGLSRLR